MNNAVPGTIGERLRRFRTEAGKSINQLADETGISKGYLWSLESDASESRPSGTTLYKIAEALGVTMSDLLGVQLLTKPNADIPLSLQRFAQMHNLPHADVQMLAQIRFRGEAPRTPERWQFIYEAIKNSRGMPGES